MVSSLLNVSTPEHALVVSNSYMMPARNVVEEPLEPKLDGEKSWQFVNSE